MTLDRQRFLKQDPGSPALVEKPKHWVLSKIPLRGKKTSHALGGGSLDDASIPNRGSGGAQTEDTKEATKRATTNLTLKWAKDVNKLSQEHR